MLAEHSIQGADSPEPSWWEESEGKKSVRGNITILLSLVSFSLEIDSPGKDRTLHPNIGRHMKCNDNR